MLRTYTFLAIVFGTTLIVHTPLLGQGEEKGALKPAKFELLSLQVTKLPRDQFGKGIFPNGGRGAFWLSNSGTVLWGRLTFDSTVSKFLEDESKLEYFKDDLQTDLTEAPEGMEINRFFEDNKLVQVRVDPDGKGAELLIRGYRTPTPGAQLVMARVFVTLLAAFDQKTEEAKGVDITPGETITIGPVEMQTVKPEEFRKNMRTAFQGGNQIAARGPNFDNVNVIVKFKSAKAAKSLKWLDDSGKVLYEFSTSMLSGQSHIVLSDIQLKNAHLVLEYFERTQKIRVPVEVETGLGF